MQQALFKWGSVWKYPTLGFVVCELLQSWYRHGWVGILAVVFQMATVLKKPPLRLCLWHICSIRLMIRRFSCSCQIQLSIGKVPNLLYQASIFGHALKGWRSVFSSLAWWESDHCHMNSVTLFIKIRALKLVNLWISQRMWTWGA